MATVNVKNDINEMKKNAELRKAGEAVPEENNQESNDIVEESVMPGENASYDYDEEMAKLEREALELESELREILDYVANSDSMEISEDPTKGGKELSMSLLRKWKDTYGRFFISKVTEEPIIYIWRPLMRLEYQKMVGTSTQEGEVKWDDTFERQKAIIEKCLLFPTPTIYFLNNLKAGVLGALEQQISYKSGFISEQEALSSINVIG